MMKKFKYAGFVFACMAAAFFLTDQKQPVVQVMNETERWIPVVMKDDSGLLVPLHVKSTCITDAECLNESFDFMSSSFESFYKTVPMHISVNSIECTDICTADVSKQILEYDPVRFEQIQQVVNYLLDAYGIDELKVDGEDSSVFTLESSCFLNQIHFLEQDYHQGNLYQMYMLKEVSNQMIAIPVVVHMDEDDPLQAIEQYYSSNASVQFDNVHFQHVQIEQGDVLTLNLSGECIVNTELSEDLILPILYSIQHVSDIQTVRVAVEGVQSAEFQLNELKINEFMLSE